MQMSSDLNTHSSFGENTFIRVQFLFVHIQYIDTSNFLHICTNVFESSKGWYYLMSHHLWMTASVSSVNVVTVFFHAPNVSLLSILIFCISVHQMRRCSMWQQLSFFGQRIMIIIVLGRVLNIFMDITRLTSKMETCSATHLKTSSQILKLR